MTVLWWEYLEWDSALDKFYRLSASPLVFIY